MVYTSLELERIHYLSSIPYHTIPYLHQEVYLIALYHIFSQEKMKIFNWIQGFQFSGNSQSCISPNGDGRRSGSPIGKGNGEKEPLLEQYVKVVSSWEFEGILTIGTLEIDPLIVNPQDTYEMLLQDSQCEVEMCNLYTHKIRDVETKCNQEIDDINEEIVQEEMLKMEKRVTLLDLLLAEKLEVKIVEHANPTSDHGNGENVLPKAMKMKKKAISYNKLKVGPVWKQGFSSKPNKLVSKDDDGGDNKCPLKNQLQRFVTRMTKKKIHPDMGAGLQKKAQGKLNDDVPLGFIGLEAIESASY